MLKAMLLDVDGTLVRRFGVGSAWAAISFSAKSTRTSPRADAVYEDPADFLKQFDTSPVKIARAV